MQRSQSDFSTYSWILTSTSPFSSVAPQRQISKQNLLHFCDHPRAAAARCPLRRSVTGCAESPPQLNFISTSREHKSRKVDVLPLQVVQRIAAGEVITGYDSVVQELVENSIDADANVIKVDIDFVTHSITVQDNGTGISLQQGLADIARCNATSKLRTLSELNEGVRTLGFRGQGLWAVAMNAARLEICSRTSDSLCGTCVAFASDGNPREDSITPVAMAPGTAATVTSLPWSTEPIEARKAMKRCKDWLLRAALCYPKVTFHLTRNGKTTWKTVANGGSEKDARTWLLAYELKLHRSEFRTASKSIPDVGEMSVVVGTPSTVHSSSKSWMITAVNGRCVGIPSIRRSICAELNVRKGRYPVVFVNICTEAGLVNWNVLPMKTKIRFNSVAAEEKLVAAVPALLRDALQGTLIADFDELEAEHATSFLVDNDVRAGMKGVISLLTDKMSPSLVSDAGKIRNGTESEEENDALPISILQARVVAQVLNTYILIEHKGGIMLIEQHVADERVLYEELLQSWKSSRFVTLKEPLKLPANTQMEWIFTLTTLGLISCDDDDDMHKDNYEIVAIPEVMSSIPRSKLVSLLLQVCREGSTIEEASASVACRLAVKNGTSLKMGQMEGIVRRLVRCNNGFTCPHGRPIFMELQTKELARLFGRSWMPERDNNGRTQARFLRRGLLNE